MDNAAEIMPRPYTDRRLNSRAAVWYYRERAAYNLAEWIGEPVTREAYEAAYDTYMRFVRFALASAREAENDNDPRAYDAHGNPRPWHVREAKRNERRADKINAELARYGARLEWSGLYPHIRHADGVRDIYGYFFD